MNLKKDTEYALRIISCLYNHGCIDSLDNCRKGMALFDLCIKTGIPRISLQRICDKLKDNELLVHTYAVDNHSIRYQVAENIKSVSLLTLIEAVENPCHMFLTFDQKTAYYKKKHHVFNLIDERYRLFLKMIQLKELL